MSPPLSHQKKRVVVVVVVVAAAAPVLLIHSNYTLGALLREDLPGHARAEPPDARADARASGRCRWRRQLERTRRVGRRFVEDARLIYTADKSFSSGMELRLSQLVRARARKKGRREQLIRQTVTRLDCFSVPLGRSSGLAEQSSVLPGRAPARLDSVGARISGQRQRINNRQSCSHCSSAGILRCSLAPAKGTCHARAKTFSKGCCCCSLARRPSNWTAELEADRAESNSNGLD